MTNEHDNMIGTTNVYVTNETKHRIDIGHVFDCVNDITDELYDEQWYPIKSIYIIIVPPNGTPIHNAIGTCSRVSDNVYIIRVTYDAPIDPDIDNGRGWYRTIAHELYHVHQHVHGIPLNERDADTFANMM